MTVLQGIPQLRDVPDVPAHVVDSQTGVVVPLSLSSPRDPNVEPGNRTSEFVLLAAKLLVVNVGGVIAILGHFGINLSPGEAVAGIGLLSADASGLIGWYATLRTKRKNAVSARA